jgi:hypothetical protein
VTAFLVGDGIDPCRIRGSAADTTGASSFPIRGESEISAWPHDFTGIGGSFSTTLFVNDRNTTIEKDGRMPDRNQNDRFESHLNMAIEKVAFNSCKNHELENRVDGLIIKCRSGEWQ